MFRSLIFCFSQKTGIINQLISLSIILFMKTFFIDEVKVSYGPKILEYEKFILISNHVNHMDWFVIWTSLSQIKPKTFLVFFVKEALFATSRLVQKLDPRTFKFFFLVRNINYDIITLKKASVYFDSLKSSKCMVLFPEGTLFKHKKSLEISISRSNNRGIKCYENVMVPKNRGLDAIRNYSKDVEAILDCTIKYSRKFSILSFLRGKKISAHLYIDVATDAPDPPEPSTDFLASKKTSTWLFDIFRKKDELLSRDPFPDVKNIFTIKVI